MEKKEKKKRMRGEMREEKRYNKEEDEGRFRSPVVELVVLGLLLYPHINVTDDYAYYVNT